MKFEGKPEEILALRRALGWTQVDLSEYLGYYYWQRQCKALVNWEKGRRKPHRSAIKAMESLANLTGVQPRYEEELKRAKRMDRPKPRTKQDS